jgi:hypothetical protein
MGEEKVERCWVMVTQKFLMWKWRLLPSSLIGFIWESAVFGVEGDLFMRKVDLVDVVCSRN